MAATLSVPNDAASALEPILQRIDEINRVTRIISMNARIEAVRIGALDYLTKPLDLGRMRDLLMTVRKRIERRIAETTALIAAEHRKGRRLYVGTTELEGQRFVIWNIGAFAERTA